MEFSPNELTTIVGGLVTVVGTGAFALKRLSVSWARANVDQKNAKGELTYTDRVVAELQETKKELLAVTREKEALQKELNENSRQMGRWEAMEEQFKKLETSFNERERELEAEVSELKMQIARQSEMIERQTEMIAALTKQNTQLMMALGNHIDISDLPFMKEDHVGQMFGENKGQPSEHRAANESQSTV